MVLPLLLKMVLPLLLNVQELHREGQGGKRCDEGEQMIGREREK